MNPEYEKIIKEITAKANDIMFGVKDHDYNNQQSTIDLDDYFPYGWSSCYTFINKHLTRLQSLYEAGSEPKNESIQDNWMDILNYVRICYAVMEMRRRHKIPPNVNVPKLVPIDEKGQPVVKKRT